MFISALSLTAIHQKHDVRMQLGSTRRHEHEHTHKHTRDTQVDTETQQTERCRETHTHWEAEARPHVGIGGCHDALREVTVQDGR